MPVVFSSLPQGFPNGLVGGLIGVAFGVFGLSQELLLAHGDVHSDAFNAVRGGDRICVIAARRMEPGFGRNYNCEAGSLVPGCSARHTLLFVPVLFIFRVP